MESSKHSNPIQQAQQTDLSRKLSTNSAPTTKNLSANDLQGYADHIQLLIDRVNYNNNLLCEHFEKTNREQMSFISKIVNEVQSRLNNFEKRIAALESSLDDVTEIKNELNDLKQDSFENHMDIVGIATETVESNRTKIKSFTSDLLKSFGAAVEENAIQKVLIRTTPKDHRVLSVVLDNRQSKISIMKSKMNSKDDRKIYFEDRLTPTNRKLFHTARIALKEKRIKSYRKSWGRVTVELLDGSIKRLKDPADIPSFLSMSSTSNNGL